MPEIMEKVAADVYPNGAYLTCGEGCGVFRWVDTGVVARYLARGWPMHCGQTMTCVAAPPPVPPER